MNEKRKTENDSNALDRQVGGSHYQKYKYQPVQFFIDCGWDFIQGSVAKYVLRYKDKNGIEDLKKAMHYCDIAIEAGMKPNFESIQKAWDCKAVFRFAVENTIDIHIVVIMQYVAMHDYEQAKIAINKLIDDETEHDIQ